MAGHGGPVAPDSQMLETGLLDAIFPLGQKLSISGVSHGGGGSDHAYNSMIAGMAAAQSAGRGH